MNMWFHHSIKDISQAEHLYSIKRSNMYIFKKCKHLRTSLFSQVGHACSFTIPASTPFLQRRVERQGLDRTHPSSTLLLKSSLLGPSAIFDAVPTRPYHVLSCSSSSFDAMVATHESALGMGKTTDARTLPRYQDNTQAALPPGSMIRLNFTKGGLRRETSQN